MSRALDRRIDRRRRLIAHGALVIGVLCALCAIGPDPARADVFETISLLSASPFVQAEYAHDSVISADGRFIVFDGSVHGVNGVWRRELQVGPGGRLEGGELQQVAGGHAELPSVSENGQYISFTTNEGGRLPQLSDERAHPEEPEADESPGVYVRDMTKAPEQEGAFTLASAENGSSQGLEYEYAAGEAGEQERPLYGSTAAGRTALSADGRKVAFVTTAKSDLAGPGTPPLQVAVRNLDTDQTQIVSVRSDPVSGAPLLDPETGRPEPVPEQREGALFGAVFSSGSPPRFDTVQAYEMPELAGASISADGSTVAWLGQDISEQAATLSQETLLPKYAEPLWRRIGEGEQAHTRRVTGGSDPTNPECVAHPESRLPAEAIATDPCQGPFATQESSGLGTWNNRASVNLIPQLSSDGYLVAFLAAAPLVKNEGKSFGVGGSSFPSDAYVADMHEGVSRRAGLRQLTEFASGDDTQVSTNSQIVDIGISPDGGQVALTTKRTVFPLGSPAYVSQPAAVPGLVELFDVDLANDTLTRVTDGYEGGAPEHPHEELGMEDPYTRLQDGALSPSFSEGGRLLAFTSTASNLVYGDGNNPPASAGVSGGGPRDGADAFVVKRVVFESSPAPQVISTPPSNPSTTVQWSISVTAAPQPSGSVVLFAELPGAGLLKASASSLLQVAAANARPSAAHHRAVRDRFLKRTVGGAMHSEDPGETGLVKLTVPLASAYRPLAERNGGLGATVSVTFSAPGHPSLHASVKVTFKRQRAATRASHADKRKVERRRR